MIDIISVGPHKAVRLVCDAPHCTGHFPCTDYMMRSEDVAAVAALHDSGRYLDQATYESAAIELLLEMAKKYGWWVTRAVQYCPKHHPDNLEDDEEDYSEGVKPKVGTPVKKPDVVIA